MLPRHFVTYNSLSLSVRGYLFNLSASVYLFMCVLLHLCLCLCATYADPGVFEGLCGSDAFTGVDG